MKLIFGLMLILAVVLIAMYYGGGSATYDPTQQGLGAKAAITPGMTWRKVLDIAGGPGKWCRIVERTHKNFAGEEIREYEPTADSAYRQGCIRERLNEGDLPFGFMVTYQFSRSVAFLVVFDGVGKVVRLEDTASEADLLQLGD